MILKFQHFWEDKKINGLQKINECHHKSGKKHFPVLLNDLVKLFPLFMVAHLLTVLLVKEVTQIKY